MKILTKNTSGTDERQYLNKGFSEWLRERQQPVETRTAEEIIDDITSRLALMEDSE